MMEVNNKNEARMAFDIIKSVTDCVTEDNGRKAHRLLSNANHLAELKREVRRYIKKSSNSHIIKDDGIDGYIELIKLPSDIDSLEKATNYFGQHYCRRFIYCAYDCTGQSFTAWYRIFKRGNGYIVYHCVSFDI